MISLAVFGSIFGEAPPIFSTTIPPFFGDDHGFGYFTSILFHSHL